MTAEIAILNKQAVALAADSAVTIQSPYKRTNNSIPKIFNSVNKLFALSKYNPVGIMIYGSAEFLEYPWESIIKIYRQNLGKQNYKHLVDYGHSFINFLSKNRLFSDEIQERYFKLISAGYIKQVHNEIQKEIKHKLEKNPLYEKDIKRIIAKIIEQEFERGKGPSFLTGFNSRDVNSLLTKYGSFLDKIIQEIFQRLPLLKRNREHLKKCACFFITKVINQASGVVIAGFGEDEVFPALIGYQIEAVVNNKLKYRKIAEDKISIKSNQSAIIHPFAQSEMVHTFISGIDPSLNETFMTSIEKVLTTFPKIFINSVQDIEMKNRGQISQKLERASSAIFDDFKEEIKMYQEAHHISPILDTVSSLPKSELAEMAEALVSLTSFKRKISKDAETVGGPIDVALISKGDGFVWIKRKHYFKSELNQQFFNNYFRERELSNEI